MAYAVMGGLVVATLLTLVFLPALYVAWFRVQPVDLSMAGKGIPLTLRAVSAHLPVAVKLGKRASKLSFSLTALAMQWRRRVFQASGYSRIAPDRPVHGLPADSIVGSYRRKLLSWASYLAST